MNRNSIPDLLFRVRLEQAFNEALKYVIDFE